MMDLNPLLGPSLDHHVPPFHNYGYTSVTHAEEPLHNSIQLRLPTVAQHWSRKTPATPMYPEAHQTLRAPVSPQHTGTRQHSKTTRKRSKATLDWSTHKNLIYDAYITRDNSLPELMEFMEKHHEFRAS
jgi:hypothetical protein